MSKRKQVPRKPTRGDNYGEVCKFEAMQSSRGSASSGRYLNFGENPHVTYVDCELFLYASNFSKENFGLQI